MSLEEKMAVRPANDWVLLRFKKPEENSLIIRPNGRRVWKGEVLAAGPGHITKRGTIRPLDVKVGERVAFFRENLEHQQGKQVQDVLHELGEDICIIQEDAILFVIEPGADVEVDACF